MRRNPMSNNVMRKPGFEPGQVALLDPKSRIYGARFLESRPERSERYPVSPERPISATQTASHFGNPPDLFADSKMAWAVAGRWFGV